MLIGICGNKQSGKDTLANILKDKLINKGKTVKVYHFADPLKDILCKTFKMSLKELEYYKLSGGYFFMGASCLTMREMLQNFGTEAMQSYNKMFWVETIMKQIYKDKKEIAIIADVRFEHELMYLLNINKHFLIQMHYQSNDKHQSEKEQLSFARNLFNYHIDNFDHKANLEKEAENILRLLNDNY